MNRTPETRTFARRARLGAVVSQASLFLRRQDVKWTKIHLKRLHLQNSKSEVSAIAKDGPVVSITTYGPRLSTVYLALESIAGGSMRPSRLILWINDTKMVSNPPLPLRRLMARGLEIQLTPDYGPHKKYYPYLLSASDFKQPLVTADDDVLYSRWWLAGLVKAHAERSDIVNCYRAHVIKLTQGKMQPYATWGRCESTEPSFRHFATGASGCIYPVPLLQELKHVGSKFLQVCPHADDVWLHANAVRAGFKIRQLQDRPIDCPSIPGTQVDGLAHTNVGLGRNDQEIRSTYAPEDISRLLSSSA